MYSSQRLQHDVIANAAAREADAICRSFVQRLRRTFERLAKSSESSSSGQLRLADRQLKRCSSANEETQFSDVNNNSNVPNVDDDVLVMVDVDAGDDVEPKVQSAKRSELHVHLKYDNCDDSIQPYTQTTDGDDVTDCNRVGIVVGPPVECKVICESRPRCRKVHTNDSPNSDFSAQPNRLYSDLEHMHDNNSVVIVDFSTMVYGPHDIGVLAEFYSDIEIVTNRMVVIHDILELNYGENIAQIR